MNQKFRVWIKDEKCFADSIETIQNFSQRIFLCWGDICESDSFDFEDVVFLQTTGTLDKNDNEIFEGDVLQIDYIKAIISEIKAEYSQSEPPKVSSELNGAESKDKGDIFRNSRIIK